MPIIQPQSPKAQREMLRRGSKGMVYADRGNISRAAPAVQEMMRQERREMRKRMVAKGITVAAVLVVVISIAGFFLNKTAEASWDVMTGAKTPVATSQQPTLMMVEAPESEDPRVTDIDFAGTSEEFLDRAKVNGVRFGGKRTRAIINGSIYHVGDVVAPEIGLVFVGHDPDGEYLLFRDSDSRTVFLKVKNEA
ncbi:hypothetical protein [Cerasicoccus frondis]|uniref:hypothetical protein n=1 Tax=Cerasicoccus frondis TaxID=490090 RepID=UPI002852BB61|nr:hypothetical protein [Cerasicoccus frondis]